MAIDDVTREWNGDPGRPDIQEARKFMLLQRGRLQGLGEDARLEKSRLLVDAWLRSHQPSDPGN